MAQLTCGHNTCSYYLADPCRHSHTTFSATSLLAHVFRGACHATFLWCNNECIHHSLYCSLFNFSLSSKVCLSSASQPIPSPKLICNYFHAAQSSLYLNHLDQIALHLLSFSLWNQFIPLEGFSVSLSPGILSLILLTVNFFFCLQPTCPDIFSLLAYSPTQTSEGFFSCFIAWAN